MSDIIPIAEPDIPLVLPPLRPTCTGWSACGRPEGCGWSRICHSQRPRPQQPPDQPETNN